MTYFVSYDWNLFLERRLPARPAGNTDISEYSEGVGEISEEKVDERRIAASQVKRASLNRWYTFYKWVLDISVGRMLIQLISKIALIAIPEKDGLQSLKDAPVVSLSFPIEAYSILIYEKDKLLGTISHIPTTFTVSSLIGMIIVPANQRVLFSTGFYFLCSVFFVAAINISLPQFLLTKLGNTFVQEYTAARWREALRSYESEGSPGLHELMHAL